MLRKKWVRRAGRGGPSGEETSHASAAESKIFAKSPVGRELRVPTL
jgi:hypothetical protein